LDQAGANGPDNDGEAEEAHGEEGVVDLSLVGELLLALAVVVHDENAGEEGDGGDDEEGDLWPELGLGRPGGEPIARSDVLGGIEDSEGGGEESEDDERAGEIDRAKDDFGEADADFNFLDGGETSQWLDMKLHAVAPGGPPEAQSTRRYTTEGNSPGQRLGPCPSSPPASLTPVPP
jgi:hypothetical protein